MTKIPSDMKAELAEWNNGAGISLETWISCEGNFRLAVGYTTIFWPRFVEFENYVLREGFAVESLRAFEQRTKGDRRSVELVMNHLHIADTHYQGCEDISRERVMFLGEILKEIYSAKLAWQFPDRSFEVSFFLSDVPEELIGYQVSFCQK